MSFVADLKVEPLPLQASAVRAMIEKLSKNDIPQVLGNLEKIYPYLRKNYLLLDDLCRCNCISEIMQMYFCKVHSQLSQLLDQNQPSFFNMPGSERYDEAVRLFASHNVKIRITSDVPDRKGEWIVVEMPKVRIVVRPYQPRS